MVVVIALVVPRSGNGNLLLDFSPHIYAAAGEAATRMCEPRSNQLGSHHPLFAT